MSKRKNIFNGDSYYAIFVRIIYRHLLKREWVSYTDIMKEELGIGISDELKCPISKCANYGELKKAFNDIINTIRLKCGNKSILIQGNNRNKTFKYIGEDGDPLSELYKSQIITDFRRYRQFCLDSAGFIPISWFEYFFKDSFDLLEIKEKRVKGSNLLNSGVDRIYKNIELLPFLYEAIKYKKVLYVEYKPFEEEKVSFYFHPHIIREFNGRWFVLGHAENRFPEFAYNIALDRILKIKQADNNFKYRRSPDNFYNDYFKEIIGVSHIEGNQVENIVLRVYSYYTFMLIKTKPFHQSQRVIKEFDNTNNDFGEIEINVEVNNELIGRVLQLGENIEVVSPTNVRAIFRDRIKKLTERYND